MAEEYKQTFLEKKREYPTLEEVLALISSSMTKVTSPMTVASSYMQSEDFATGSKGWKIKANGDVEFNNGYFRGDITGASGTFSGSLTAASGSIGGWTIAASSLTSGAMTINSSTGINFNSAFSVNASGSVTATSGSIGGWTLGATTLSATGISLDAGNHRISVGATSPILIDGTNKKIESSNYVSGFAGSGFHIDENLLEVGNIACRGLIRTSVFQKDVISTVGGHLMVLDGDVLAADMTASDSSTMTTKATTAFAVGDILRIKDGTNDEWFTVTNIASAPTYSVTRDRASAYASNSNPAWSKGATIVNYGQSGDGGLFLTASETNAPYLSVFTHAGSPWSALTTRLRIGNLNGYLGYSSDVYGIGIGDDDNYLKFDPTDKLQIKVSGANALTIEHGSDILLAHGGDLNFTTVTAPSTACTGVALETAGNLAADYYIYAVTFVNPSGETDIDKVSERIYADATHQQIQLSNIPISSSAAVTARKIYRRKAGGGTFNYYYLATINDNTTTTYTDNIADASLGIEGTDRENTTFGKFYVDNEKIIEVGNTVSIGRSAGSGLGNYNIFIGEDAGYSFNGGSRNVFIGYQVAQNAGQSDGSATGHNVVIGASRGLFNELTGRGNTIIGSGTDGITTTDNSGSYNVFIGCTMDSGIEDGSYQFALGSGAYKLLQGEINNWNLGIGLYGSGFGGGKGVIKIGDVDTLPTSNPNGGGYLYVQSGALKYRGSSGTITTIANA